MEAVFKVKMDENSIKEQLNSVESTFHVQTKGFISKERYASFIHLVQSALLKVV
jgi:hypothetical protein